jgi:hypothetical protein
MLLTTIHCGSKHAKEYFHSLSNQLFLYPFARKIHLLHRSTSVSEPICRPIHAISPIPQMIRVSGFHNDINFITIAVPPEEESGLITFVQF